MNAKPHICFTSVNNVGVGFSGADRIFTELLKAWKARARLTLLGAEEAIIISKRNGVEARFLQASPWNRNPQYGLVALFRHTFERIRAARRALQTYSKELADVDVVYSVSDFYPDFLPAYWMKRRNPKIKWIAGYYLFAAPFWKKDSPYKGRNALRGLIYWLMQRPSYHLVRKYADFVFVTSEPDVEPFVTRARGRDRIAVVQGGVDVGPSERYLASGDIVPPAERTYDACFVGRLHFQKGVMILPDIWKLVCEKRPGARLALIGDGHLEREVKEKVGALGLQDNIDLLGFMDGERKFEIFKQSRLMVHPATYDSGGMAAAEGMAWRLPGVSFDLEALKTYYPQGMVKVPRGDLRRFADEIIRLLEDPVHYNAVADAAHELITTVWDWRRRGDRVWEQIEKAGIVP